jgi:hypothetical protein
LRVQRFVSSSETSTISRTSSHVFVMTDSEESESEVLQPQTCMANLYREKAEMHEDLSIDMIGLLQDFKGSS